MKALGMRTRGDDLECEIYAVPGWGGFDQLVKYLTNTWSAQVTDSIDGPTPESRRSPFRVDR